MLHASLELLEHLQLLLGDVKHDLEVPDHTLDLALKLAFFPDVQEWHDEVAQAVVNVGVCQPGEDPSPFPVLFGPEGMLGGLNMDVLAWRIIVFFCTPLTTSRIACLKSCMTSSVPS